MYSRSWKSCNESALQSSMNVNKPREGCTVRLDKWLWAARFYKTRALAKKAIEGGKVRVADQRVKVAKEVSVGELLTVRQGFDQREVRIAALSDQRYGAPEARLLYEETAESIAAREQRAADRKASTAGYQPAAHKPDKRQRRQMHKWRERNLSDDD